jgi:hypothetical protein
MYKLLYIVKHTGKTSSAGLKKNFTVKGLWLSIPEQ